MNQLRISMANRFYSAGVTIDNHQPNNDLNMRVISGFVDGEGCFSLTISKDSSLKIGWRIKLIFKISSHIRDREFLELIKNYFKVGNITKEGLQSVQYRVSSIVDLERIITYLDKYKLITQKYADYELFKKAHILMKNKEHLTESGLLSFIAIKASMNWGLSPELQSTFPGVLSMVRPIVLDNPIYPEWVQGFSSAEGCFLISLPKSSTSILKTKVQLVFQLTQHSRDEKLMRSIIDFFSCGNLYKDGGNFVFRVSKFEDISNKIIPFFQKYPIMGVKNGDFLDFCRAAVIIKNKNHLTPSGLDEICQLKTGMNKGRLKNLLNLK